MAIINHSNQLYGSEGGGTSYGFEVSFEGDSDSSIEFGVKTSLIVSFEGDSEFDLAFNSSERISLEVSFDGDSEVETILGSEKSFSIEFQGDSELEAEFTFESAYSFSTEIAGDSEFDTTFKVRKPLIIAFEGDSELDVIINEGLENWLLDFQGDSDLAAIFQKRSNLALHFQGDSELEVSIESVGNAEQNKLRFILDVLPVETMRRFREYRIRCKIGNTVLPIKSFNFQRSSVSSSFTAQLARLQDRVLITNQANFKFEIGEVISGVTDWKTLFEVSKLTKRDYSIGWSESSPTDTFEFSLTSDLSNKLNKVSIQTLVMFDGSRTQVSSTEVESIRDTTGTLYSPQLINVGGLSIFNLFEKIFVEKCGFASYRTNIPDWKIRRADFTLGRGFYESLRGYLGMFDLAIFNIGNVVWILDKSSAVPAGFPAPRELVIKKYKTFQKSDSESEVEAFFLNYVSNETEQFIRVQRLEQEDPQTVEAGQQTLRIEVNRQVFDYFPVSYPTVLAKTVIDNELRKTYQNGIQIGEYLEDYYYDSAGRTKRITKTNRGYSPQANPDTGTLQPSYVLQRIDEEETKMTYGSHPFIPYMIYQKEIKTTKRGLISTDEEDEYLNEPFKQEYLKAHEAGNLKVENTINFDDIETTIESFKPLRNGQVKSEVHTINHLRRGLPSVPVSAPKVGNIALNPNGNEKQAKILVLATDAAVLTGKRIEDFHIGEMPLYLGIPLARRQLRRRQNFSGTRSVELLGLDLTIEDGTILSLKSRDSQNEGNFLVESVSISGTNLATTEQEIQMSIQGEPI